MEILRTWHHPTTPPAVIPAQAGTQYTPGLRDAQRSTRNASSYWVPAFAGMTFRVGCCFEEQQK
jgi:hypothetical protein